MGIFERYLSVWVGLCIAAGVGLGVAMPELFAAVASIEYASVNLVVAVLIWVMIYPMMINVDFASLRDVGKKPKGLCITLVINWLVKPFTMEALGIWLTQASGPGQGRTSTPRERSLNLIWCRRRDLTRPARAARALRESGA
jgi:ACR3 family arsenite transporter